MRGLHSHTLHGLRKVAETIRKRRWFDIIVRLNELTLSEVLFELLTLEKKTSVSVSRTQNVRPLHTYEK